MARNRWTAAADSKLKELWPGASYDDIQRAFPGHSRTALAHRAARLSVKRVSKDLSEVGRAALSESARRRKPRLGKGLVAPVFTRDGVEGKVCIACLEWLPLPRYARHATCSGGRRHRCTTCEGRSAYASNPAARINAARAYQRRHPEAHLERKRAASRRRHGRKVAGAGVPVAAYRAIRAQYGGLCAYCGVADGDTIDHVIPLSRGGKHDPGNIVPACKACNFAKHTMTLEEWRGKRPKEHG